MSRSSANLSEDPRWWDVFNPLSSIRAQAALVLGTLAAILTLVFSEQAADALERRIEADAGPLFETLAGAIRERIDRGLYERFHELQVAAAMPTFREPAISEPVRRAALNLMNDTEEQYAWIGFADAEGRLRVGTHGLREGTNVSEEPWFRTVLRGGTHVGDVHEVTDLAGKVARSDAETLKVIDLAVPVTDSNGKLIGALCGSLRWSWVEQAQELVVPESARRRLLGVTIYSSQGEALLDTGTDIWGAPLPYPPVPVSPRGQQAFRGHLRQEGEDVVYLTGYAQTRGFRNMRSPGWMITVRQPDRRVFTEVTELRANIRLIGFSATAFIVVGAWGFAGLLTQRLRAIESAANYIRDGDALALIPRPAGRGDLARMCRALSRMVAALHGTADSREKSGEPPGDHKP